MAAVVGGSNWCKLLLALLLLTSAIFATGVIDSGPVTHVTFLDLTGKDGIATATLTYSSIEVEQDYDHSVLAQAMQAAREGDQAKSQELLSSQGIEGYVNLLDATEPEPLAEVDINFYYVEQTYNDQGEPIYDKIGLPGCVPVSTDAEGTASCPVPEELYNDTCIEVFATYGDPVYGAQEEDAIYQYSQDSIQVCGKQTKALANMSKALQAILSDPENLTDPLCLISMIMGGLLLASMFFAGRSPLSLLDITTPLLPKAKSIAYRDLKMGTGFSRMGPQMAAMGKGLQKSSRATYQQLLRKIRSKRGYNKALMDKILNSGASDVVKMMALRGLLAGQDRTSIERILRLSDLFKKGGVGNEEYLDEYGRVLSRLGKAPGSEELNKKDKGLHDMVMSLADMNIRLQNTQASFGASTGSVPPWLKGNLGKTLGKLPFIGTHIMGGTASLFFGGRHLGRIYSNVSRGVVRKVGDAVTPEDKTKFTKRVQMSVERARAAKRRPGILASWIAAPDLEKQTVAKIFNNFEYGSEIYKRMMKQAKKDVLNWLVSRALKHFGGNGNLTEAEALEIGKENPDQLMFKGMNMKKYKEFEAQLRNLLSNGKLDDIQKARQMMQLLDLAGINYDKQHLSVAVNRLVAIDRFNPQNFDATAEYTNKDDVLNCHRLLRLQKYLNAQFEIDQPIDVRHKFTDKGMFAFMVGRTHLTNDDTFGVLFNNVYRKMLETRTRKGEKPLSITEAANYNFLRVVNERWGIIDPANKALSPELRTVMQNAQKWLQSLVDPNGAAFSEWKHDISKIPMDKLMGALYSPSARDRLDDESGMGMMKHGEEYGAMAGAWRMDMHAHWKTIMGPMGGAKGSVENQAYGEVHLAHTVPRAVQTLMDKRGVSKEKAEQQYLNKTVVPSHLFKRLRGMIEVDASNTYTSFGGEFKRFHEQWEACRVRIYERPELIGLEKGYFKKIEDISSKEGKKALRDIVSDKRVEEFINTKLTLDDVSKSTWLRLKEGSFVPFVQGHTFKLAQADRVVNGKAFIRRGGRWEEFAPEKFERQSSVMEFFGKHSKLKKALFGETDYALGARLEGVDPAYVKRYSAIMQGFDRDKKGKQMGVRADQVKSLLRDLESLAARSPNRTSACAAMAAKLLANGSQLQQLGLDRNSVKLSRLGTDLGDRVKMELLLHDYEAAINTKNEDRRKELANDLKDWAREGAPGEERQVKVALFFNRYAQQTEDWTDLNGYTNVYKIAPAAGAIRGGPDEVERYEQVGGLKGWLKRGFDQVKEYTDPFLKRANIGLEQFALSTFGKQMQSEYEGSLNSEYLREAGGKFAAKLAAGEFGNHTNMNDPAMREYNRLMDSFTRFHAVWDDTITRDPRGNSSAIGHASIYSGFFHHGPAMAFGPGVYRRWTHAGYKQPWTTGSGFVANVRERLWGLQYAPMMFNWAIGTPFGVAYRTYITSRWGFMTKYDRQYRNAPEMATAQSQTEYRTLLNQYQTQFENFENKEIAKGISPEQATKNALQLAGPRPEMPPIELDRDTLNPYAQTAPRKGEAQAAMLNWFYSAFDPTASNWKRFAAYAAASPILPIAQFIPSRWVQSKILGNGTALLNREDNNPYYATPGGLRGQLIKYAGPMVKRQYGGTEMITGVVRAHEDTWAYQAGVNAVWGNTNPGASYMDFSNSLHLDPRAANYLRFESRFRPFYKHDEYIKSQANMGLVKRDVDPIKMMMDRNAELRHYRFPENTIFRFLSPATYAGYKSAAWMGSIGQKVSSLRGFFQEPTTNVSSRGAMMASGPAYMGARAGEAVGNYMYRKFAVGMSKAIRHCQSCGSPMPEGGSCRACSQKIRCPHCQNPVDPSQSHNCMHGLSRTLLKDALAGDGNISSALRARPGLLDKFKKWGREV